MKKFIISIIAVATLGAVIIGGVYAMKQQRDSSDMTASVPETAETSEAQRPAALSTYTFRDDTFTLPISVAAGYQLVTGDLVGKMQQNSGVKNGETPRSCQHFKIDEVPTDPELTKEDSVTTLWYGWATYSKHTKEMASQTCEAVYDERSGDYIMIYVFHYKEPRDIEGVAVGDGEQYYSPIPGISCGLVQDGKKDGVPLCQSKCVTMHGNYELTAYGYPGYREGLAKLGEFLNELKTKSKVQ